MKFLAILRDSLREAIDAKVFYVMIGLSTLLIGLAFTCTFTPRPGGDMLMRLAVVPLVVDLTDLKLSEKPEAEQVIGQFFQRYRGGMYEVIQVQPVDGARDRPNSTFVVRLRAQINKWAGPAASDPEGHIRRYFGQIDKWRIAEVIEVRRLETAMGKPGFDRRAMMDFGPIGEPPPPLPPQGKPGILENVFGQVKDFLTRPVVAEFEVKARVTPAGRRFWPCDFSLFFGALPILKGPPQDSQNTGPRPPEVPMGVPLGFQLWVLENYVVNGIGAWVAILVSIVITAFFIPNMLRKGTVDLLLVKPMRRTALLLYKYVGGLLFILVNTAVAITGVWVALGLRSGIWAPAFLLTIWIITFFFAILYSVSTLFGVLTRSPVVAILLTCGAWLFLFIVGVTHNFIEEQRKQDNVRRLREAGPMLTKALGVQATPLGSGPLLALPFLTPPRFHQPHFGAGLSSPGGDFPLEDTNPLTRPVIFDNGFTKTVAGLHYILPRTRNLDDLTNTLLLSDLVFSNQIGAQVLTPARISWGESLTVSGIFIAVMLGLACWRFATRDY